MSPSPTASFSHLATSQYSGVRSTAVTRAPRSAAINRAGLDNLVNAGILGSARRPTVEYPIWASVHGLAVLLRGPLRSLPERDRMRLEDQMLAFIGAAVS
jgi:hypothetical protein